MDLRLAGQIVAVIAALCGLAGAGASVYARAALAATDEKVALLQREDVALGHRIEIEESYRKAVLAKLDALCRATPRANCPLGENER